MQTPIDTVIYHLSSSVIKNISANVCFLKDYESKLEALQRQVDSRYLESPEEEEEPEEEGDTVIFNCY